MIHVLIISSNAVPDFFLFTLNRSEQHSPYSKDDVATHTCQPLEKEGFCCSS